MITGEIPDFVTVEAAKTHLNKTGTADDVELAAFVSAACRMIVDRVGHVGPVDAVTDARPPGAVLVTEHRPVLEVTAVVRLPGGQPIPKADPLEGTHGWRLASREGLLRHTAGQWGGPVRVTYVCGRDPIPATISLAALELVAYLWRTSQTNAGGGRPPVSESDETVLPGSAFALPYRVRQLLGLDRRATDHPLTG